MNKLYNNQSNITSEFKSLLLKVYPNIKKTILNFLPSVLFGIIKAESITSSDIANSLSDEKKWAKLDSIKKRIYRFWNNKHFNPYVLWDKIISYIINFYVVKHNSNKVYLAFDHMFSHSNYTIFMISMRVGTQGIPIYFKVFKGKGDDAFKEQIIIDGISYVSNLFNGRFELIFTADRWFNSTNVMRHIDSLGHTYAIRLKGNVTVYENGNKTTAKKLKKRKYKAVVHKDVYITKHHFKTNIVISNSIDTSTPWIIATNKNIEHAISNYSYRFSSIEFLFKNQKSNGFYIEKISNASLDSFTNMYTVCCIAVTFLTIIGTDYTKNTKAHKNHRFTTHSYRTINGVKKRVRIMSLFNVGLTLFKLALESSEYIRVPFSLKLYDI